MNRRVSEVISIPRTIPLMEREAVAFTMTSVMLGDTASCPDTMSDLILRSLFQSRSWKDAVRYAEDMPDLVPEMIGRMLPKVLDAIEGGLGSLDWDELPEEERRRTEGLFIDIMLRSSKAQDIKVTDEERQALSLLLRMLSRALDREIAPLLERLRHDAEVLERLEKVLPGQGWDLHRVDLHRTVLGNLERYAGVLRKHQEIERLLDLLGRMDGTLIKQAESNSQSCTETHSLRFSGDIHRMLPQEMVNLGDDRLKLLFYARMCERRLLTYELRGREEASGDRRRKGPVVALLDSSGSMTGEPEIASKALMLALGQMLAREGRPLRVLMFSVDVKGFDLVKPGASSEFLEFLCHTFNGGTDFDAALRQGIACLEDPAWQGADILFLTDGLARVRDRGCMHDWNILKERLGARIFTILVGGNEPGGLQRISDRVYLMSRQCEWQGGSLLREFAPQSRALGSCCVTQ